MIGLAPLLMAASAAILLGLGTIHLIYTFHGPKLRPRDAALQQRMAEVFPVLTRETTMWRAWIGFNASHSYGEMLFGLVYGYMAPRPIQLEASQRHEPDRFRGLYGAAQAAAQSGDVAKAKRYFGKLVEIAG